MAATSVASNRESGTDRCTPAIDASVSASAHCAVGSPMRATSHSASASVAVTDSPAHVDTMAWATASPMQVMLQRPRLRIPVSILLNPEDLVTDAEDVDDSGGGGDRRRVEQHHTTQTADAQATAPLATEAVTAAAPAPKRRGRKPHLPKMNNSERGKYYRNKRKLFSEALVSDVKHLRTDVARLQSLRDMRCDLSISMRMSLPGSLARLVREYFAQFRYGVQLPPAQRNTWLPDVEVSTVSQDMFMAATMTPDVGFGEYNGIATVMDQWVRYSQYHALLEFELLSIEITGSESAPILFTNGQLRTRYSRKTIENVFPHVVGNEALTQRLIGREVVYPCRNQFYFSEDGRIERYDVEADFADALVAALGNTDDAVLLLGQALIQKQHMMGVLDDDDESVDAATSRSNQSSHLEVEYLPDECSAMSV